MASASSFKQRRTPGVYITELDAFPPSIVGVQTAVPAFIGYTEKADINGKPVLNQAIKIGSLADYEAIFGKGYKSEYTITPVPDSTEEEKNKIAAGEFDFKVWDSTTDPANPVWKYYDLKQLPPTDKKYNLYDSMRLFYANGGGNCFVVSVGQYYATGATTPTTISADDLSGGLAVIKEQVGPTMLVIPDAVLLPASGDEGEPYISSEFQAVVNDMLTQCGDLQDRVAVLDVYGTDTINTVYDNTGTEAPGETTVTLDDVKKQFYVDVGDKFLNYGMAYFPFLHTTVVSVSEVDYTSIVTVADLQSVLTMQANNLYPDPDPAHVWPVNENPRYVAVLADITAIADANNTPADVVKYNQNLTAALPLLIDMERTITRRNDVLPPSGAMAGVYTYVDGTRGVWNAPANLTLSAVPSTTYKLNNLQQGDLNLPVNGKAIDALREFVGRGTVVWGARTLDGNSKDWRYIQVRRTLIYVEQSIKNALDQFVFAANDGKTWVTVISMVSNFLQGLWSQGGLMGATASEAYAVECGLGSTMTADDILDGYMIVQVTLQMIRPAEFIELTFKQKMDG